MEIKPLRTDGEMETVIQTYQSVVYGLAFARTGSAYDADDVFQETFLAYFRSTGGGGDLDRTVPGGNGKRDMEGSAGPYGRLSSAHIPVLL